MTYRSMIIGLGQIGMGYDLNIESPDVVYSHAKALTMHPNFQLVCGVDACPSKRELFSRHFNVSSYPTISEALQKHDIDFAVIATPTSNHCDSLHEILQVSKPKLILCEKPLSYSRSEARLMVESCERSGVSLFTNYIRRADPSSLYIKSQIESGEISGPIKGIAWYSKGLLHNGSHLFDLLKFWLGPFINAKIINKGRQYNDYDFEPDFLARFERGEVTFIAAWEEAYSHHTIELVSPTGRLRYDCGGEKITWQSAVQDLRFPGYRFLKNPPKEIQNESAKYQLLVTNQLAGSIHGSPHTLCSGKESVATLESILSIFELANNEK